MTPHAAGVLTFDKIALLRESLCPEASDQASLIGFVRAWPHPALLLRAQRALKKADEAEQAQGSFGFRSAPTPSLRAVQVTVNEAATAAGLAIPPNMRVPERSVINRLFAGLDEAGQADEDLSWWTSSDGGRLPSYGIHVTVRRRGDHVQALIVPDLRSSSGRLVSGGDAKAARRSRGPE